MAALTGAGTGLRGGFAVLAACLLAGCFRAPTYEPGRFAGTWQAPPAAGDVDREQAAALAIERSPDVAAARAAARAAERGVGSADQMVNPELRLSQLRLDQVIDSASVVELGLRFKPERPGAIDARIHEATMLAEEAHASADLVALEVAAQVRELVDVVHLLDREARAVQRLADLRELLRREVAERVEVAAATRMDLAEADLDLAMARDDLAALRLDREKAAASLARLVGGATVTAEPDVVLLPPDEALVRRALAARPELRASAARIAAAEGEAWVARSEAWPWLSFVQVEYDIEREPDPLAFGVALAVELPLLSWNSGAIAEADARVAGLRAEQEATARRTADAIVEAAAHVRATSERVRAIREELMPAVEAAAASIRDAVDAGAADPTASLRADLQSAGAERRLARALRDHRQAVVALEAALGGPLQSTTSP